MSTVKPKTLVIIPTYNEIENLPLITKRLFDSNPKINLLIVDDNSPDGTGELADQIAKDNKQINVMHRTKKDGLGGAYIAGFKWGIENGFQTLVEMDADGSHKPEQLQELLEKIDEGYELVLGSRYVKGGKTVNWPKSREFLSKGGNTYIKIVLGVKIKDITGGYRAFNSELLKKLSLDTIESHGYCFQIDLAYRSMKLGAKIIEVPITFVERELGESKMSGSIIKEALTKVTFWSLRDRFGIGENKLS